MLGRSIFSGYFSLAAIVLALRVVVKSSGMQMLLGGLVSYYCVDPSKSPATQLRAEDLKTKKGRAKALNRQQLQIKGASEQIYRQSLSAHYLASLPFSDEVNALVSIGLSVVLNALYVLLASALLGWELTVVTVAVSLLLVVYTVMVLFKVEYAAARRSWAEAGLGLLLVLGGSGLALALLCWLPSFAWFKTPAGAGGRGGGPLPLHTFDIGAAARGFDALVGLLRERVAERIKQDLPEVARTHPVYMGAGLAVWAGMLAMAMLGPGLQYSRMLYRALNVPGWGDAYMQRGWGTLKLAQLGLVLPILVVVSQIPPLACYWGLPLQHLPVIGAALLIATALVHWLAIPALMQTYLDGGLTFWHVLLHNGVDFEGKMNHVRQRLDSLRVLLGKACAQVLSPALIGGTLGLLLLLHSGLPTQIATATAPHRQAALAKLPDHVARVLAMGMVLSPTQQQAVNLTAPVIPPPPAASAGGEEEQGKAAHEDEGLLGLTEDGSAVIPEAAQQKDSAKAEEEHMPVAPGKVEDLWLVLSHFLGWWTCLVWSLYAGGGMVVARLGLNSG